MSRADKESETVEFKSSLSELKEGIVSMVAMLNKTGSGTVYFGIADDGNLVGVNIGKDTLKNLTSTVFDSTDPHIIPSVEVLEEAGKNYICVKVTGNSRPYLYKGVVYVRTGEEDRKAPADEIRRMFRSSEDLLIQTVSSNQNLEFNGLKKFVEKNGKHITSKKALIESCNLKNTQGQYNIQAHLLSDQNDAQIIVAVFKGTDRTSFSRRDTFTGRCLIQVVEDVNNYVQNMNETITVVDSKGRIDTPLFDSSAFKEAWINACVHNSWMIGNPPYVHVFDDRIEIISFGGLPYWLPLDKFYDGVSQPVNESLMNVFMMSGLVEHTGHGVPEIVARYGKDSIAISEGMVKVTLKFKTIRTAARLRSINQDEVAPLSDVERRMLILMFENPRITLDELSEELGMKRSTIASHCSGMQNRGILQRSGSKKTGSWVVKVDLEENN
jgi:predicted HTH transcriptional regulator